MPERNPDAGHLIDSAAAKLADALAAIVDVDVRGHQPGANHGHLRHGAIAWAELTPTSAWWPRRHPACRDYDPNGGLAGRKWVMIVRKTDRMAARLLGCAPSAQTQAAAGGSVTYPHEPKW